MGSCFMTFFLFAVATRNLLCRIETIYKISYSKYQENTLREIRNGGIGKSVQLKDVVS